MESTGVLKIPGSQEKPQNWCKTPQNVQVLHVRVAVGLPVWATGRRRWKPELPRVMVHFPSSPNATGITFPELAGSVSASVLLNDGGGEIRQPSREKKNRSTSKGFTYRVPAQIPGIASPPTLQG